MQRGISYPTGNCFVKVKCQFSKLKKIPSILMQYSQQNKKTKHKKDNIKCIYPVKCKLKW